VKRGILAAVTLLTLVAVGYACSVTRRERQFGQRVVDGDAALSSGDLPAAVAAFGDAVSLKPESMLGYLKRGDAHRRRGELEAAAADLERAHTLNPTEPRVLELLGDVARARQLHDAAAGYYAAYVAIDDRPKVLYKLGLARHLGGHHREAVDALRAALKIDPRFAEAHYLLGVCLRATKQLAAAQASLERAVAVAPNLLAAREQLADIHGLLGRRTERIKQLNELLLADASPARQVRLATAYAEAGQVSRAIVMLRAAAELYPTYPGTYLALGQLWLDVAESGDRVAIGKALEALQHAVSMEASSAALTMLGRARLLASDPSMAEHTLRQATETLPAEPSAFLHLADAADRTGHVQVARRALLDYQALTGASQPDFLVRLAHAHWRSGDTARARAALQRALANDPDHHAGRSLERRLR
jgi:tetratricopeptide (TPR) repeat protein